MRCQHPIPKNSKPGSKLMDVHSFVPCAYNVLAHFALLRIVVAICTFRCVRFQLKLLSFLLTLLSLLIFGMTAFSWLRPSIVVAMVVAVATQMIIYTSSVCSESVSNLLVLLRCIQMKSEMTQTHTTVYLDRYIAKWHWDGIHSNISNEHEPKSKWLLLDRYDLFYVSHDMRTLYTGVRMHCAMVLWFCIVVDTNNFVRA